MEWDVLSDLAACYSAAACCVFYIFAVGATGPNTTDPRRYKAARAAPLRPGRVQLARRAWRRGRAPRVLAGC